MVTVVVFRSGCCCCLVVVVVVVWVVMWVVRPPAPALGAAGGVFVGVVVLLVVGVVVPAVFRCPSAPRVVSSRVEEEGEEAIVTMWAPPREREGERAGGCRSPPAQYLGPEDEKHSFRM